MTNFRIDDAGVPWVGDKAYPEAAKVNDNTRTFGEPTGYDGFQIHLPNEWIVHVMWATRKDWPEYLPLGEVGSVDAHASGFKDALIWHNPDDGDWPHKPYSTWTLGRVYFTLPEVLDAYIQCLDGRTPPPWSYRD